MFLSGFHIFPLVKIRPATAAILLPGFDFVSAVFAIHYHSSGLFLYSSFLHDRFLLYAGGFALITGPSAFFRVGTEIGGRHEGLLAADY
jgi:hypothetical protein